MNFLSGRNIGWVLAGGAAFWVPAITAAAFLHENIGAVVLNAIALAGIIALIALSWSFAKQPPPSGLLLLGIYVLGPVSMFTPSLLGLATGTATTPGDKLWILAFCLFPPMTLWMATLNGMIFAVLVASIGLPLLHVGIRRQHSPNARAA
jgi:hypothetical protein